jgi:TolC family type I secretion outer membrane protein
MIKRFSKASLFVTTVLAGLVFSHSVHAQSFEDALASAYNQNPSLKAERENLKAADERVSQAYSGFRPSLGYSITREDQEIEYTGRAQEDTDVTNKSWNLTQPLFRGGETIASVESTYNTVKASREFLKSTEQQVLLDAITAYMSVIRDTSVYELSKNNTDVLKQRLDMTQERFNVGELTRTDVAQSEARYSSAIADMVRAEGTLKSSRAFFERVIRLPAGDSLEKPAKLPKTPKSLHAALKVAAKNNPDLKTAEFTHKAARNDIWVSASSILPRADFVASRQDQDGVAASRGGDFEEDSYGFRINIPLYQSGSEYSRVRQSKRFAERRQQQFYAEQDRTRESVTQAWENLQATKTAIKSIKDSITAAELALEGVKLEAEYGARTILDTLDAQQELFRTQVDLVRAESDEVVATYGLLSTMGSLTSKDLGLKVEHYDPESYYKTVRYLPVGL